MEERRFLVVAARGGKIVRLERSWSQYAATKRRLVALGWTVSVRPVTT